VTRSWPRPEEVKGAMRGTGLCVLAVLMVAGTVAAQQVTIEAKDVALADVVELLKQQTGVQIVGERQAPPETPPLTLQFERAPLKKVIRELCKQAGMHFTRFGSGYHLLPGVERDDRPLCVAGDYEVRVEQIIHDRQRVLTFKNADEPMRFENTLRVNLTAEAWDDEATARLYAFDPAVRAVTDGGAVLEPRQKETLQQGQPAYEHLLRGYLPLEPPPPEAVTLATLEGDIVLFADLDRGEFEFALDQEVGQTKETERIAVTLQSYDAKAGVVTCELSVPPGPKWEPGEPHWSVRPMTQAALVTAKGDRQAPHGTSYRGEGGQERYTFYQTFAFSVPPEFEPVKLAYQVTVPRNPAERLHYKFENLPLPTWQEGE
jgi:hypothetical protein